MMTRARLQSVILIVVCVSLAIPVLAGQNDRRIADLVAAAAKAMSADQPADEVDPRGGRRERDDG